jgi:hypothetical protein
MAVAGFIARVCGDVFSVAGAAAARGILVAGFQMSLLIATYAATLGSDDSGGECFALWTAAMVATSPIVWEHLPGTAHHPRHRARGGGRRGMREPPRETGDARRVRPRFCGPSAKADDAARSRCSDRR